MKTPKFDDFYNIDEVRIFKKIKINLPCNSNLLDLAAKKRKARILSEVLFWQAVRNGNFYTIDFDRQKVIGNYIVDFYVKTLSLIIEIDGCSHDDKIEYDKIRSDYLTGLGLKIFRIGDIEVKRNLVLVMCDLKDYLIDNYCEETPPRLSLEGNL